MLKLRISHIAAQIRQAKCDSLYAAVPGADKKLSQVEILPLT